MSKFARATLVATLALVVVPTASAATPTINITVGNDPVEGVTTQLGVTGSTDRQSNSVSLTIKPAGGQPCAANYDADDGTGVFDDHGVSSGASYSYSTNFTLNTARTYLACAWLYDGSQSGDPVVATGSTTFTVRIPKLAIAISPIAPQTAGAVFQIVTTTQAEAQRRLYEYIVTDTGRGCPANASAASSPSVARVYDDRPAQGGPISDTQNLEITDAGQYLACAYFQYSNSSDAPEAVASTPLTIVAPPPPCVVPTFQGSTLLADAKTRLLAADCAVAKVKYLASARYARGTLIKTDPVAGTQLAARGPVTLYVSSGKPCIVPRVPPGTTVARMTKRLTKAGCSVGSVRRRANRHKRGVVIKTSPARGTHLSPRAEVSLIVSKGRRRH